MWKNGDELNLIKIVQPSRACVYILDAVNT